MPEQPTADGTAVARLAGLPRLPDSVLEGGRRTVAIWIREGNQVVQPDVAIWLDARSRFIRATRVINPLAGAAGGLAEALEALLDACTGPFLTLPGLPPPPVMRPARRKGRRRETESWGAQPGLPAKVLVNDATLADAARALFAPLDVPVEYAAELPAFEEAFASLSEALGADPDAGPPEPFAWEIDAALLPPLYKAAAAYARRAPWRYMPDYPPVVIELGERGPRPEVPTLYACILGGGGVVTGVAFYYAREAVARARDAGEALELDEEEIDAAIALLQQLGAPVDELPPDALREVVGNVVAEETGRRAGPELMEDGLVCFFDPEEESDPTYLEWLQARGVKYATRHGVPSFFRTVQGGEPELPAAREVAALTLALAALDQFFGHFGSLLKRPFLPDEELTYEAQVGSGRGASKVTVPVGFDPFEELDDDGDEE